MEKLYLHQRICKEPHSFDKSYSRNAELIRDIVLYLNLTSVRNERDGFTAGVLNVADFCKRFNYTKGYVLRKLPEPLYSQLGEHSDIRRTILGDAIARMYKDGIEVAPISVSKGDTKIEIPQVYRIFDKDGLQFHERYNTVNKKRFAFCFRLNQEFYNDQRRFFTTFMYEEYMQLNKAERKVYLRLAWRCNGKVFQKDESYNTLKQIAGLANKQEKVNARNLNSILLKIVKTCKSLRLKKAEVVWLDKGYQYGYYVKLQKLKGEEVHHV